MWTDLTVDVNFKGEKNKTWTLGHNSATQSKLIPNQVVLWVYRQTVSVSPVHEVERNWDLWVLVGGKKNPVHEVMNQNVKIGHGEALVKGQWAWI